MSIENYGSYQLIKKLAMGGMAQIYLARRKGAAGVDKQLVVKRILPHLAENDDFIKMFLDEARIAARLNHPNIVQIYDLGAQDDSFFIAMEYIHGEDVRRVWKRSVELEQPLPVALACRIIAESAAGLDHAHKATDGGRPLNIVHRDVSPQNILVTFEGGVKVVDFGIAKAADQATVTRSGVLKGKYSYMSPEQASGSRNLDRRVDVFALGVVLYELLTGVRLFKRPTDMQTLKAVAECQVTPPSQLGERVPESLDAIVMKALAKDPDARYSEARHLQLALEEWLSANRQPASASHLAAFMRRVFSDRLEEEARLGEVVASETPPPTGMRSALEAPPPPRRSGMNPSLSRHTPAPPKDETDPATPRPQQRPSRSMEVRRAVEAETEKEPQRAPRRKSKPALVPPEPVRTPRPAPAPAPEEVEEPASGRWWIAGLVAVLSAVVVGGGLWTMLRPGPAAPPEAPAVAASTAKVRLVTDPPGATVVFNGGALAGVTPLSLPPVPPGRYTLVVAREGYREQQTVVDIPATGALSLGPLKLVPLPKAEPEVPAEVARVQLTLEAVPAQATVTVDGVARGRSPVVVSAAAGKEVEVRVEAAKYRPLTRKVRVGEGSSQSERFVLEALPEPITRKAPEPPPVEPKPEPRPPAEVRKASVRFAVTPWADVSCGGRFLGTTPFPDVALPLGVYECKFTNPDLGKTKTQKVEVKAIGLNKVVVAL